MTGCHQVFDLDELEAPSACRDPMQLSHDEDGDGILDGCDLCPNMSDADQLDTDGDDIGDACDPEPEDPHDRLAYFDPFTSTTLDPRWLTYGTNAQWVIGDDAISQVDTSTNNFVATLVFHETFASPVVVAVLSGQTRLDAAVSSALGIYTRVLPDAEMAYPAALFCFSFLFPPGNAQRRALVVELEPDQVIKDSMVFQEGDPVVLQAASNGSCRGRVADGASVAVSVELGPLDGEIALSTRNTTGTFSSIAVYETVP